MRVPFHDQAKLYRRHQTEIDAAIADVLTSGRLDWGDHVPRFEAEFADWCGATHAVTTNSGSAALKIALLALGIKQGDEVITVANTDSATPSAIRNAGAIPVFVDIEPRTRTMAVHAMKSAVTSRTRAIMPVDMYGHPADIPAIVEFAAPLGIPVVEDACLALGAEIGGRRVGQFAAVTCFSFAPSKHLGAFGSGGCALTEDPILAQRMGKISGYGQDRQHHRSMHGLGAPVAPHYEYDGSNERLDELQAAILRVKLPFLQSALAERARQASRYSMELSNLGLGLPSTREGYKHAWRNYVVTCDRRDEIRKVLAAAGIATNTSYAPPMHVQPAYRLLGYGNGSLPTTELVSTEIFGLPIGPHLEDDQINLVVEIVHEACRGH
jgi:dTDP-3-amino-3,4,6-trideoxy-alpha-D-glucose transaminase